MKKLIWKTNTKFKMVLPIPSPKKDVLKKRAVKKTNENR